MTQTQIMTNDLILALVDVGFAPKLSKVNWICENYESAVENGARLFIGDTPIYPSRHLKVLCSMIPGDGSEREAYLHRAKQAWKTYYNWKHVLEAKVSISARIRVFQATVCKSLLWGLETTRQIQDNSQIILTTQSNMVRKMMGSKRRPLTLPFDGLPPIIESWLDWQIRTLKSAISCIEENDKCIASQLIDARRSWALHVGRFGTRERENHLVKN